MISRSALYAVRAMAAFARLPEGAHGITREIAQQADVPASYLSKILQTLSRAGLVRSQKGLGGGFSLAQARRDHAAGDRRADRPNQLPVRLHPRAASLLGSRTLCDAR